MPYALSSIPSPITMTCSVISETTQDFLTQLPHPFYGHIHSIFQRACNIQVGQTLIGILSKELRCTPSSFLLSEQVNIYDWRLSEQDQVIIYKNHISLSDQLHIGYSNSTAYSPSLTLSFSAHPDLVKVLEKLITRYSGRSPFFSELASYLGYASPSNSIYTSPIHNFLSCIGNSTLHLEDAAQKLCGLGEGLTPSGDDFLAGFISVLSLIQESKYCSPSLLSTLSHLKNALNVDFLKQHTTVFGAHTINWAKKGHVSDPVKAFLSSLWEGKNNIDICAENLLKIGHYSGSDMMAGIVAAFYYIEVL